MEYYTKIKDWLPYIALGINTVALFLSLTLPYLTHREIKKCGLELEEMDRKHLERQLMIFEKGSFKSLEGLELGNPLDNK